MLIRSMLFLALVGLVAQPAPARAADDATSSSTVVIRVQSIDNLVENLKYFASLVGKDSDTKQIDALVKQVAGQKLPGVDTKRPLGLYGRIDDNPVDSTVVVLVPVSDEKAFINTVENLTKTKLDKDDEVYNLQIPGPFPGYLRFANKYAYATVKEKSALDKGKLIAPDKLFAEQGGTVSASFNLANVPETIKQVIISQVEPRLAALDDEKPANETKAQHAFKVQTAKEVASRLTTAIKEGGEISARLDLNRQTRDVVVELSVAGKSGSDMAKSIASIGQAESLFAGLATPDGAMNLLVHGALPSSLRSALGPVIDEGIQTGLAKEKDEAKRARATKVFKVVAPSLKSGELDAGFSLRGPGADKHYTIVAGLKVKDGRDIESAFRDELKNLPEAEKSKIKVDAESAGDVKIHRIDVQKDLDENARRNLGENPFYLAFRNDALFIAGGEDGLSALKTALEVKPAAAPPVRGEINMTRFADAMAKGAKGDPKSAIEKAFAGSDKDHDKIRFTVEGGQALKVRLELNAPVLKFLRLMEKQENK